MSRTQVWFPAFHGVRVFGGPFSLTLVYDTLKLPEKSVRIPWNQQGIFLKKGRTYCIPFTIQISFG